MYFNIYYKITAKDICFLFIQNGQNVGNNPQNHISTNIKQKTKKKLNLNKKKTKKIFKKTKFILV